MSGTIFIPREHVAIVGVVDDDASMIVLESSGTNADVVFIPPRTSVSNVIWCCQGHSITDCTSNDEMRRTTPFLPCHPQSISMLLAFWIYFYLIFQAY